MIRITIAEGLKRMYKEYRLKQWQKLLDKASTLRRLLQAQELQLENDHNSELSIHNASEIQGQLHNVPSGLRQSADHVTPEDWQRAAPEAYDWYPVNDYQNRTDSSEADSQSSQDRSRNSTAASRSLTQFTTTERSTNTDNVRSSTSHSSTNNLMEVSSPARPTFNHSETVSQDNSLLNSSNNRDILDMDSLNEVVEEMEASFQEISEMITDFISELVDSQHQNGSGEAPPVFNAPLMSPVRHPNQSTRNQDNVLQTTPNIAEQQMIMTSSPAGRMRVLDNMSHASQLGETMSINSPSRARLLWRDDPPNPADHPPRLLAVGIPRYMQAPEEPPREAIQTNQDIVVTDTNPTEADNAVNDNNAAAIFERQADVEQADPELDSSLQSYVSWESSVDSDDIDTLPGILYAAERLGPMDQTMHMDVEMGDFGIGHLLFDRASGTWATSHCEFHRID